MFTPLFVYAVVALAVLLAFLGIVVINMRVLPTTTGYPLEDGDKPFVAVLIPVRNEQGNIAKCLRSLMKQDYPSLMMWLYDDDSDDGTLETAKQVVQSNAQNGNAQVRVIAGKEQPPAGWLGKAHALHSLYQMVSAEAQPDYLLFTDADVEFDTGAVSHAVAAAQAWDAGLLSIFPRQQLGSFAERLAVPTMLHWTVYNFLPLPIAFSRVGPNFAAANGQFMLFKREAYEASGGHEAVRSQILEDVALARATKRAGYRAILADGGATVHTRMYEGANEVWRGYSKNAYAFFGYKPYFLALGVLALSALYILPLPMALGAFLGGNLALGALFVAMYLVAVQTRLLLSVRFAYPLRGSFLHPLAVAYMIAIEINSMVWAWTGKGSWKGRGTRA